MTRVPIKQSVLDEDFVVPYHSIPSLCHYTRLFDLLLKYYLFVEKATTCSHNLEILISTYLKEEVTTPFNYSVLISLLNKYDDLLRREKVSRKDINEYYLGLCPSDYTFQLLPKERKLPFESFKVE